MPNEHVRNLLNAPGERRGVIAGVRQSAAGRGLIALTSACYTVWMIACCLGPAVSIPLHDGTAMAVPSWMGMLLVMGVTSTVIAIWSKRTRHVLDDPSWLVALASIMTLAAALHLVWAFDRSLPSVADIALYVLMCMSAGVAAALFRVEIDRVFGWIGTQQTLYQGMLGTLAAFVLTTVGFAGSGEAVGTPLALSGIALVLPFAAMLLMRRVVAGFPHVRYFQHGRDVPLPFPAKFVATSVVQGIAAGVLYMSLFLFDVPAFGSSNATAGQLIAVLLLFATLVFLRLDFNRFIYKVVFSLVAVGFLLLAALPSTPQVGFEALAAGFCYLDLVLWSLGACLMKNMGLPTTWVASCPGAALFFGVLAGGVVAYAALGGHPFDDTPMFASFASSFLFACALLLSSGSNLKHGWGTVLPGEGGLEVDDLAGVVRFVATERG